MPDKKKKKKSVKDLTAAERKALRERRKKVAKKVSKTGVLGELAKQKKK